MDASGLIGKKVATLHCLNCQRRAASLIHEVAPEQTVVTTDSDGFFTYHLKTKAAVHYSSLTCKALPDRPILSAYVDRSSEVWFEQEEPGVVAHFNPATGVVTREQILIEYSNPERSRPAFHIFEDVNGFLWVHPYGGGFSFFDRQKGRLVPFYNELGSHDWRFSNKIHSAFSGNHHRKGNIAIRHLFQSFGVRTKP